ncbi:MAG: nuclear transport factor 2 family protein [Bacteroidia bacterium]
MTTFAKTVFTAILIFTFSTGLRAQVQLFPMSINAPVNNAELVGIATQYVESLVKGEFKAADALIASNFMIYHAGGDSLNKEALIKIWKSYHADATGLSFTNGEILAMTIKEGPSKGDWALIWGLASWTPNVTKQPVYSYTHMALQIEKGKVIKSYQFEDNLAVMMQMGYQLVPPVTTSRQ